MDEQAGSNESELLELTSDIVSAFVSNNTMRATELSELIASVHTSLAAIGAPKSVEEAPQPLTPAVSIKKSITDEYLISLEDGRKFRTLKRHLAGLGMTPEQYRAKWNLPRDYPMVAPGYATKRSELAKLSGLGNDRRKAPEQVQIIREHDPEPEAAPEPEMQLVLEEAAQPAKKTRGRPKKAA